MTLVPPQSSCPLNSFSWEGNILFYLCYCTYRLLCYHILVCSSISGCKALAQASSYTILFMPVVLGGQLHQTEPNRYDPYTLSFLPFSPPMKIDTEGRKTVMGREHREPLSSMAEQLTLWKWDKQIKKTPQNPTWLLLKDGLSQAVSLKVRQGNTSQTDSWMTLSIC